MSMEMAVVSFDGTHTAEQKLSSLRASRDDAWLMEVAVLEHHHGGRFSMKATSPDYGEEGHVGSGAAIGGLTGMFLGTIAGPLANPAGRPSQRGGGRRIGGVGPVASRPRQGLTVRE